MADHDPAKCRSIAICTAHWMDQQGHAENDSAGFYLRLQRCDGIEFGLRVDSVERVAEIVDTLHPNLVCLHVGSDENHADLLAQIVRRPAALH